MRSPQQLGFPRGEVEWVYTPFNRVIAPGRKAFDFDINQISYTPDRAKVVTFSASYYNVNQSVVGLKSNPISKVRSRAGLKGYKLGAQLGTTSYQYIVNRIKPCRAAGRLRHERPRGRGPEDEADRRARRRPADRRSTSRRRRCRTRPCVGQFPSPPGGEHFGLVFQKGNPLVSCVNRALGNLKTHRRAGEDRADLAREGDEGACPQVATGARGSSGVAAPDAPSPSRSSAPSSSS